DGNLVSKLETRNWATQWAPLQPETQNSSSLAQLPGRGHQPIDRGPGQGGDVLSGQVAGDSLVKEDAGLRGKLLISPPQDVGHGHQGKGQEAGGGVPQTLGLAPGHDR